MTSVYKIMTTEEWNLTCTAGVFAGSEVDLRDGFIHLSARDQVEETAARHFHGKTDLVLLQIDTSDIEADLKWEVSRNGQLFPHLYGKLSASVVQRVDPLPWDANSGHLFPWGHQDS